MLLIIIGLVFIFALIKPLLEQEKFKKVIVTEEEVTKEEPTPFVELPLHNVDLPKFSNILDVKEKKRQFFNFLRPAVIAENKRILALRAQLQGIINKQTEQIQLTTAEHKQIASLAIKYKIKKSLSEFDKTSALLNRVDIVPSALVLVQAANESAWGTSRFARIGLNFFGIWCYKKGCGMIPKGRDAGLRHEVAAFDSVEHSVKHYLHNINTNHAYHVFREIRAQLHQQNLPLTADILATGLLPYSERGTDYIVEITEMIRHNKRYLFTAEQAE